jgi:uncharacterized protein YbaP (TraB family)
MHRFVSLASLLALLILPTWVRAQDENTPPLLLWKASRPEGGGVIYVFGTMHAGVDQAAVQQAALERIAECAAVVTEIDMRNPQALQAAAMKYIMLNPPDDRLVDELLGAEHFGKLCALFARLNGLEQLPEPVQAQLKQFHPAALSSQIQLTWLQGAQRVSVDEIVTQRAVAGEKELVSLETIEQQLQMLFRDVDIAYWVKSLKELLDNEQAAKDKLEKLRQAYMRGDVTGLMGAVDEMKEEPKVYELLAVKRNQAWAPRIDELTAKGNVFVAVGSAHLIGEDSVLELLKKRGYNVDRINR